MIEARKNLPDSPVFQKLIEGFPDIKRLKTDVFRDEVQYSAHIKKSLSEARKQGLSAVSAVAEELTQQVKICDIESGVIIDLYLSYRAVKGWQKMIELVPQMSLPLANTVLVQEQLGLALNRAGRGDEAETVLKDVLESAAQVAKPMASWQSLQRPLGGGLQSR